MGFAKFFLLGTFGECLKFRLTNTKWIPSKIILRAVIWGIFGIWITWAFVLVDAGVEALIEKGLWLNEYSDSWRTIFWVAFSKSIWINILSGYAFFMMLMHLLTYNMIKTGHTPPPPPGVPFPIPIGHGLKKSCGQYYGFGYRCIQSLFYGQQNGE
jgi:hypothetical protein